MKPIHLLTTSAVALVLMFIFMNFDIVKGLVSDLPHSIHNTQVFCQDGHFYVSVRQTNKIVTWIETAPGRWEGVRDFRYPHRIRTPFDFFEKP